MANEIGLIRLYIRISEQEYQFIKELSDSQNIDLCDWLRDAVGCKLERDGGDGAIFFASSVSDGD
jgi:hypothetical protein